MADIQHEIEALPPEQQTALLNWLAERDRIQWDIKLERDFSPGGPGSKLLDHIKGQVRNGESRPLADYKPRR